jgi:hypothetical protein
MTKYTHSRLAGTFTQAALYAWGPGHGAAPRHGFSVGGARRAKRQEAQ